MGEMLRCVKPKTRQKTNSNMWVFSIIILIISYVTALFNNMQTLKFKSQPTNAFFATVNQMFGASFQLPTTTERAVNK